MPAKEGGDVHDVLHRDPILWGLVLSEGVGQSSAATRLWKAALPGFPQAAWMRRIYSSRIEALTGLVPLPRPQALRHDLKSEKGGANVD